MGKLDKYKIGKVNYAQLGSDDFTFKGDPFDLNEVSVYGKRPKQPVLRKNNLLNKKTLKDSLDFENSKKLYKQYIDNIKYINEIEKLSDYESDRLTDYFNSQSFNLNQQLNYLKESAINYAQEGTPLPKDNFMYQWTNSPMHLEMLKKSDPENYEKIKQDRLENLDNTTLSTEVRVQKDKDAEFRPNTDGIFPSGGKIVVFDGKPHSYKNDVIHEASHASDKNVLLNFEKLWNKLTGNTISDRHIPTTDINKINNYKDVKTDFDKYVGTPTETRARLNELRSISKSSNFYDPFTQKITPESYNKLKNSYKTNEKSGGNYALKQLQSIYSDAEIIDMLNTISYEDNNLNTQDNIYTQQGGQSNSVIAEDKEYIKTDKGQILKIKNAPTHNDRVIQTPQGNKLADKGGILLNGVQSVLSATQDNRTRKDRLYTYKDEEIKISPADVKIFNKAFDLNVSSKKSISPAKLLDKLFTARNSKINKFKNLGKEQRFSDARINSLRANKVLLAQIPKDKELYDAVFEFTEGNKSENQEEPIAQLGLSQTQPYIKSNVNQTANYWKNFDWINPELNDGYEYLAETKYPGYNRSNSISDDERLTGYYDYDENVLNVRDDLSDSEGETTINHEFNHWKQYNRGDRAVHANEEIFNKNANISPYSPKTYPLNSREFEAYYNDGEFNDVLDNVFSKEKGSSTKLYDKLVKQKGGVIRATPDYTPKETLARYMDRQLIPYIEPIEKAINYGGGVFKKQYPKTTDTISAITAITQFLPNKLVSIPSQLINTALDINDGDNLDVLTDITGDLLSFSPFKKAKIFGKAMQLVPALNDITNEDNYNLKKALNNKNTYLANQKQTGGKLSKYYKRV